VSLWGEQISSRLLYPCPSHSHKRNKTVRHPPHASPPHLTISHLLFFWPCMPTYASLSPTAQDPAAFSSLTNQPLSALLPTVPMLPSKNPDFPDALVRRSKDPNKAKGRKSAAGAGAAGADGGADAAGAEGGATGEGLAGEGGEAEPEEGPSVKKPKAKPRARKSVVVETEGVMNGEKTGEPSGLEKTLAEQAAKVCLTLSLLSFSLQLLPFLPIFTLRVDEDADLTFLFLLVYRRSHCHVQDRPRRSHRSRNPLSRSLLLSGGRVRRRRMRWMMGGEISGCDKCLAEERVACCLSPCMMIGCWLGIGIGITMMLCSTRLPLSRKTVTSFRSCSESRVDNISKHLLSDFGNHSY
jgi:hypothetical protein